MSVCFPMQMQKRLFGTDDVVGMTVDVNCYGLTKKSSYLRGDNPERKMEPLSVILMRECR